MHPLALAQCSSTTCPSFLSLPFDIQVDVAARVAQPQNLFAACHTTAALQYAPQLMASWLLNHRMPTHALAAASAAGQVEAVRCIIDAAERSGTAGDLDLRGAGGAHALSIAATRGHVGVLKLLLAGGAPADGTPLAGRAAERSQTMHAAVTHVAAVVAVPAPGPEATAADVCGLPLAAAARGGHVECVRALLEGVQLASCLRNDSRRAHNQATSAVPAAPPLPPAPPPPPPSSASSAAPSSALAPQAQGSAQSGDGPQCHPIFSLGTDPRPAHAANEEEEAGWLGQSQESHERVPPPLQLLQGRASEQRKCCHCPPAPPHPPDGLPYRPDDRQQQPDDHQLQQNDHHQQPDDSMQGGLPNHLKHYEQQAQQQQEQQQQAQEQQLQAHDQQQQQQQAQEQQQQQAHEQQQQQALEQGATQWAGAPSGADQRQATSNRASLAVGGPVALRAAAGCGHAHVLDCLLSRGVDARAQEGEALCVAAAGGHNACIAALLAVGCPVDAQEGEPLIRAATQGHLQAVQLLWASGAHVGPNKVHSLGAALIGAAGAGHEGLVHLLLDWGAHVDGQQGGALRAAAAGGHAAVCHRLLAAGADAGGGGSAALQEAVTRVHAEVVALLLEAGADAGAANHAPIRAAAGTGHVEILQLLLRHGADPHCLEESPLRTAASAGALEVVAELLQPPWCADVHANEDEALLWAVDNDHVAVVRLLLAHGAHPGEQALWCAVAKGHDTLVKVLMDAGASLVDAGPTSAKPAA